MLYVLLGVGVLLFLFMGLAPVIPAASRSARVQAITQSVQPGVRKLFDTTSASADITAVTDAAGIETGMSVFGPGVPAGATVLTIVGSTVTLSAPASATATNVNLIFVGQAIAGLNGRPLRLFKSAYSPSLVTTLADLTAIEADFAGYTPPVLAISYGYVDSTGTPIAQSQLCSFAPTDAVTPNSIYGWWVDDGTNVLAVNTLAGAVALTDATKELALVYREGYPPGPDMIQVLP